MRKIIFISFLSCIVCMGFAQTVQLVKPTAGDIWKAYTVQKIQWTSTNIANIKLECSLDSGRTWSLIVGSYPASATYYNWTVPYKPSDSCYIRISDVLTPPSPGEVFNNPFKIPSAGLSIDSLPGFAYAKTVLPITWVSGGIQRINIYVSYDGGTNYKKIADSINTDNAYYNWVVPDTVANNCLIKLKSVASDSTSVVNNAAFQIRSLLTGTANKYKGGAYDGHSSANNSPKQLVLSVLSGNESVSGNTNYTIKWVQNNTSRINVLYSQDNGVNWQTIVANIPSSSLSYAWVIPVTPTNTGKIKIVDAIDSTLFNVSPGNLIIKSKSLKINSPDSLSVVYQNTVLPIGWTSGGVSNVKISLLYKNVKTILADSIPSGNESFNWVVPPNITDSFRILLTDKADSTLKDTSVIVKLKVLPQPVSMKYKGGGFDGHAVSANTQPVIRLIYPAGGEVLSVSTKYTIKWTASNLDRIRLDISLDSGKTWSLIADSISASSLGYDWKSPVKPSVKCLIRVRNVSDSSLFNINSAVFTLLPKNILNTTDSLNWTKGTAKSIEWQSGGVDTVKIAYKTSVKNNWVLIKDGVSAVSNIVNWIVPATVGDSVWIKITDMSDSTITDEHGYWGNMKRLIQSFSPVKYQGGSFDGHAVSTSTLTKKIIITNPIAFETIGAGNSYSIKWTPVNIADSIALQFSIDGGINWANIATVLATANNYLWQVPKKYTGGQNGNDTAINSTQCQIRALALPVSGNILVGANDRTFTISSATPIIKSITPSSGTIGDSIYIRGSRFLGASIVKLNADTVLGFTVVNDSTIRAKVGTGSTGPVYVKNPVGFNADTAVKFVFVPLPKPAVISFSPSSGTTGTQVQIKGTGFSGTISVTFGGTIATGFSIVGDTIINATVGAGSTGKIRVTNSGGYDTSKTIFTYTTLQRPIITSITPSIGTQGTSVTIRGKYFLGTTSVRFGNVSAASYSIQNDSSVVALVGTGATGPVYVNNNAGTNLDSSVRFTYTAPVVTSPAVISFSPSSGTTGTQVQIKGTGLSGTISVTFGGTIATAFSIVGDTIINATVGAGSTGKIRVTNSAGYDTSKTVFTYTTPQRPLITLITPSIGTQGTSVTIRGKYFLGTTSVKFGNVSAASYSIQNDSSVVALVGTGATGPVYVNNSAGTNLDSSVRFTYTAPVVTSPAVISFSPSSGTTGTQVQIKGTGLSGTMSVTFGGTTATAFSIVGDTIINATVGAGSTGKIRVTNSAGYDTSKTVFTYTTPQRPLITLITPSIGTQGTSVTIRGKYFLGTTSVKFGNVSAASYSIQNDSSVVAVVGTGATGPVYVNNSAGTNLDSSVRFTYTASVVTSPAVISFSPSSGTTGTQVQIKGTGLSGTMSVTFGGTTATAFSIVGDTIVNATVGAGSTGKIRVTNSGGYDTSKTVFTYFQKPIIKSFTPEIGFTGTNVQISGTHFTGVSSVLIGGSSPTSFTVLSDSLISIIVGNGATGNIVLISPAGNDTSSKIFTYYVKPGLSSFTPDRGIKGTWIQLNGKGFTGANAVSFGGVLSDSITVVNDSLVYAKVGQGNTGIVRVYNLYAYDSSKTLFTYIQKPSIKSFTPEIGSMGTTIQISGMYFTGVSSVVVGGISPTSFSILSDSLISLVIGSGASGKIIVQNPAGNDTSSKMFSYYLKPSISSFSPSTGTLGDWIQINGKNFTGVNRVSFGGTKADSILIVNDSLITAKVGLDGTGKITVSNLLLSDTSKTIFTYLYKPVVNSFTPTSGATGTVVTISGLHFAEAQSVLVGGSSTNYTVVNDSTITIMIGTGTTGQITVTNNNGKNSSTGIFTYFKPPVVTSFTPTSGTKGTVVTILGSGFNGVSSVSFGATPAISFVVNNDSLITAIVGAGSSGFIKVENNKGTGVSSSPFTYNIIVLTPIITSFTPNSGLVGSLITIIGKNLFLPQQLTIGGVPAVPVSNTGDTIVAMVMPGAITGPVSITTSEGSATSSGNQFTVSTSFYPSAQQGFKIFDSTANGLIKQGSSVALSADGNIAVIGGTGDNNNRGAAWIYKRNSNVWQKIAKLIPNDNTGSASFGVSVSISADGKTVLLGGETDNKNNGAAWVFINKGFDTWVQQGVKLVCTGSIGTQLFFGHSVSLSADGNTAVIGGNGDNNNQGAVWVFMRNGSSWIQQGQKLVGSDNSGPAAQGSSVAVSADGNTLIEGGINDNASTGAVWIFSKKNGSWIQQGLKLVANDKTGASKQGSSVAISGDGNTILNGGTTDNTSSGAAWIFTRTDSVWTQDGSRLTGKGLLGKTFNESAVALSADGKLAIVGQKGENNNIGSSSLYQKVNGYWKQQGLKLSANDASGVSYQGNSVAISSDGNTVLMGGFNDANGLGATWAFVPANIWLGGVSTDWDTPNNWTYANIPQAGDVVVVPKTVNQPIMSSSSEIGKLVLDSATILTLNGPLKVSASISNNGSIVGTGSLILNGLSPRQIIGKGVIRNLTLYDSANVSIDADTTSITGSITPNKGILKTNGNIRLMSTSGGSASIGIGSGNYLTGNVIVQRYISNLPDWRMIGFPFVDSSKIAASQLKTFFPYGYSAFSYSEPSVTNGNINTGWTPFASGQITSGKGLLMNGGEPISTMQLSAPVNTGTINIPLSYTQFNLNNGWNLISNPYPANINWNTIIANNPSGLQNAIYRYDPYSSSYAAYVNGVSTGNLNNIIENGAGFFVRSIGATSLTVREADKTFLGPIKSLAGFDTLQSMSKAKSSVRLSLLAENEKNADEVIVRWGVDPATDYFDDKFDAFDLGRSKLADLSVVGEDKTLYSIFHGSALKSKINETRTIRIRTGNMKPGAYSFNSNLLSPMFDNNELYLVDDYLRKSTLISSDSSNYSFVVTSDSLSALNSRFRLTFNYKAPDNTSVTGVDIQLLNNPSSDNQFVLLFGTEFKRVEWSLVDERGIQIKTGTFYDIMKGQTKTNQTGNVSSGLYFIKLIADGQPFTPLKWIKQ